MQQITKLNYAFHIHTSRCGHASADPAESYVQTALQLGLQSITFTDHAPFPNDPFRGRMQMNELDAYEAELKELQQKYASQIAIHIGLEVEYMPEYRSYYQELHDRFELLILGQHHTSFPDGHYTFEADISKSQSYIRLIETIPEAMETGLFAVVAHPDRRFHYDREWTDTDSRIRNEIFAAAEKHNIILERNAALIEDKKVRNKFWQDIPEHIELIYGMDAHSPEDIPRRLSLLRDLETF